MTKLHLSPAKPLDEQFETLKYRILGSFNGGERARNTMLAFTSCAAGEGVSTIAASFAASLANEGERRVLLMDGNLRKPYLSSLVRHRTLAASGEHDKSEPFGQVWQVVRADSNLDMLVTNTPLQKPSHVFHKAWFLDLLKQARNRYDCVVVDCPPVTSDGAAAFLAAKANAVVLVVEAERLRREVVQQAVALLEDAGANILGTILNKRRYPIPQSIYRLL